MLDRLAPEQYDTLPDIPEPAENPDLVGHDAIADELAHDYAAGKLHHGLLFAGPRGIGKATLAFRLANHLLAHPRAENAPARMERPASESSIFRMVASGAHPGVLHLTRPFDDKRKVFRTGITVDEIRRLSRFLSMSSHDGGWRIVIVDPADDMNRQAANALLKSLEEPPRRTLFVLVSHQPGRLLPTIRSRCRIVRFHPLSGEELRNVLSLAGNGLEADGHHVVERAGGSAREALLLTMYGGLDILQAIEEIMSAKRFDAGKAYRLAEAVTGRDKAVQFSIFNDQVLSILSGAARTASRQGAPVLAAELARHWSEALEKMRIADGYNLDGKEHVVGLVHDAYLALQGTARR
ncbi:MAG: DNA polymerase III subunit delta' [Rhizobiaceae bacterium]|nr:DNA polymerase III subunit delta' [Rhizobiaceae bacterium]MCV0406289.1 DNA polymerase III subunit delta' [Rhizobiaceae bacterium]